MDIEYLENDGELCYFAQQETLYETGEPWWVFEVSPTLQYIKKQGILTEVEFILGAVKNPKRERYFTLRSFGVIPKEIQGQEEVFVSEYVKERIAEDFEKQKTEAKKCDKLVRNSNFEIKAGNLEGKILSLTNARLYVVLEKPEGYCGEDYKSLAATGVERIFTETGEFSDELIVAAKELLVGIYKWRNISYINIDISYSVNL